MAAGSVSDASKPGESSPGSPRAVPLALIEAVRAELLVLAAGDLEENLKQISDVVLRASELFVSIRGAEARVLRGVSAGPSVVQAQGMATSMATFGAGTGFVAGGYANPEQFGASAIRQLVSLVPEMLAAKANSPDRLMKAISLAKKEGRDDIVQALTRRLLGDDAPPEDHVHCLEMGEANGEANGKASGGKTNGKAKGKANGKASRARQHSGASS